MATKPFSMKIDEEEFSEYKDYADKLGLPLSVFIKMVLKLYAKGVYDKLAKKNIT